MRGFTLLRHEALSLILIPTKRRKEEGGEEGRVGEEAGTCAELKIN